MANLYEERREDETPTVRGLGGGSIAVDWAKQPTGFQQGSQILASILSTLEQEEAKKQKKLKDKEDTYKTLREAGYDPKAAYEAATSGSFPAVPPAETTKEKKEKAEVAETEASTELKKAQAGYYREGGPKRSVIDKMTPNQLQSRLKFLKDELTGEPEEDTVIQEEIDIINDRLRTLSSGGAAKPASGDMVEMIGPDGKPWRIPKANVERARARGFKDKPVR